MDNIFIKKKSKKCAVKINKALRFNIKIYQMFIQQ